MTRVREHPPEPAQVLSAKVAKKRTVDWRPVSRWHAIKHISARQPREVAGSVVAPAAASSSGGGTKPRPLSTLAHGLCESDGQTDVALSVHPYEDIYCVVRPAADPAALIIQYVNDYTHVYSCEQREEVVSSLAAMCDRAGRPCWVRTTPASAGLALQPLPLTQRSLWGELEEYVLKQLSQAVGQSAAVIRYAL